MAQGVSIKNWSWGICKPETCTEEDLLPQLKFFQVENSSEIRVVFCKSSFNDTDLLLHTLWYSIVILLLSLVFVGTYMEHKAVELPHQSIKSVFVSFSLITNWKTLFATVDGRSIGCLNGIRVISMLGVFALHLIIEYLNQGGPIHTEKTLSSEKIKVYSSWSAQILLRTGFLAVDAFFLLSGIVLALEFINDRKARVSFSYFHYVAKRYLRLTPPLVFVVLTYMTVYYDLGSGPAWKDTVSEEKKDCIKNWWTNFFYINNYIGMEICVVPTWFLAANMQLYWVAPMFLFILYQNRKFGVLCVVTTCVVTCVCTFFICFINHFYKRGLLIPSVSLSIEYYSALYMHVETWAPPFLFGLVFGYILEHFKKNEALIRPSFRVIGWTVSALTIFLAMYFQLIAYKLGYGDLVLSLYESVHRSLFAIALAWIIFICNQGYGGVMDRFLSYRFFEITSRLTYCFYLLHYMYRSYEYGTNQQPLYLSYFSYQDEMLREVDGPLNVPQYERDAAYNTCKWDAKKSFRDLISGTVILTCCAAVLALTLEFPFIHLSKMIFKKKKKKIETIPAVTYSTF